MTQNPFDDAGGNPFMLDSPRPSIPLSDYVYRELRYRMLRNANPEEAERLLAIDPHAPQDLRGNACRNIDAFHEAFAVQEGDGMWLAPQERVTIF